MTADERIEQLLNRAGQTISDLPDSYGPEHISALIDEAWKWHKFGTDAVPVSAEYALHLADVIDRMEIALNNLIVQNEMLYKDIRDYCVLCKHDSFGITNKPMCEKCGTYNENGEAISNW